MRWGEQLRIAQLDGVAKIFGQLTEKIVELVGPLQRIRQVLPTHRLELEHKAPRVIPKHSAVGLQHIVLEERRVQKVRIAHPGETRLRRILTQSHCGDTVPDLADTRERRRQGPSVGLQLLLRGRIVEHAVDPDRAKQGIARVLLESLGRLRTAIAAVVDIAKPTVIGPGGRPKPNARWDAFTELEELGAWGRKCFRPKEIRWRHAQSLIFLRLLASDVIFGIYSGPLGAFVNVATSYELARRLRLDSPLPAAL